MRKVWAEMRIPVLGKGSWLWLGISVILDAAVLAGAFYFAYALRFGFRIPAEQMDLVVQIFPIYWAGKVLLVLFWGLPRIVPRYVGVQDLLRISGAVASFFVLGTVLNLIWYDQTGKFAIPFLVLGSDGILSAGGMAGWRVAVRLFYERRDRRSWLHPRTRMAVAIWGIGEEAVRLPPLLRGSGYCVVAFLDPEEQTAGGRIQGIPVFGVREGLRYLFQRRKIRGILLVDSFRNSTQREQVIRWALRYGIQFFRVPSLSQILADPRTTLSIQPVNPVELLSRPPALRSSPVLRKFFRRKKILVTGAAGSIGSELVRLLVRFGEENEIWMVDHAETPLLHIHQEVREMMETSRSSQRRAYTSIVCVPGDITDAPFMEEVFRSFQPDVVLHAAAFKHVPLAEAHPYIFARVNILGTCVVYRLARRWKTGRFVMISTDKAVNPRGIMGMTKRVAELWLLTHADQDPGLRIVRFGNVLGSAGSVVETFWEAIQKGKPLPITHPEMERYFMTIPEACLLVLEVAAHSQSARYPVYVLDMGKPVRVMDLARKMLQLAGIPPSERLFRFTGLRPGEKIKEELYDPDTESPVSLPENPGIWRLDFHERLHFSEIRKGVEEMIQAILEGESSVDRWRSLLQNMLQKSVEPSHATSSIPGKSV